jgi:hypothetical protein
LRYRVTQPTVVAPEVNRVTQSWRLAQLCGLLTALSAMATSTPVIWPQVSINVYNDANVRDKILSDAEREATRIYLNAGVETIWIDCRTSKKTPNPAAACAAPLCRTHLTLHIVAWTSHDRDSIFGIAFLSQSGEGTYSDVFYPSAEKLHTDGRTSLSRVLGHVMAHEIGHLLLGTNSHSALGLMRPHWQKEELRSMEMGTLLFTPQQGKQMRIRLGPASPALELGSEQ